MAEKRVIEIQVKSEQANKAIDNLTESNTDLAASFEDVYGEMQPLSGRMGELEDRLYELALAGKQNTKEYKDLQAEVSKFKRVIAETDASVDGASATMSQKLGGALGGIASAFELGQSAMISFGVSSQEVEEALLKVQSAMAISQGFQGIKEAIPSFKALGTTATNAFNNMSKASKAFAITGIGLLVTGLGLVIAYWDDIKEAVGGVTEEEQKLADFRRKHEQERREFVANESKDFASSLAQLKATNKGSKERSELITEINQKYGTTLKNLSDEAAFQNQINQELENYLKYQTAKFKLQANEDAIVQNLKTQSRLRQEIAQSEKDLAKAIQEGAGKTRRTLEDGVLTTVDVNEKASIAAEQAAKKIRENEKALADAEKRFENYGKAALKAGEDISKLTNNGKKYVEQNKEVVKKTKEATEEIKRNADEGVLALDIQRAKEVESVNDSEQAKYNYLVYWGNLTNDYYKEQAAKRQAEIERNKEFAIQTAQDTLSLINSIAEIYGKRGEKQAKRAFEIQKAASIASALISTYQSAVSAYQSQFLPIPDPSSPIRGAVAAGVAVAAGLTNVAKIASQKFEGGGSPAGGGGNVTAPSGDAGGSVISPNFNIVGNAQATNPLAGLGNQPLQAYVVSGEVTTAQSLDRNRINYATFG